jgi:serine/threonine protein kinase/Flp pilus assembly protein TadD
MEEYLKLLQAGERPDRAAFVSRYPDLVAPLTACLQGLDFVHAAGAELSQPATPGASASADTVEPAESLGDFRIIREIGRGGMGIVYEAQQISLGRRVALKVLPFAATMDPRQLQRFKNEAHAAAQLHHTNIVPVYSVGCERGVHFYAMQFIEGHSLAEMIAQLRQVENSQETSRKAAKDAKEDPNLTAPFAPSRLCVSPSSADAPTPPIAALSTVRSTRGPAFFRLVADLGIQAAEALDCAHQQGIVHRDVKPANLMLDATGRLWVTDFGLAQIQSDTRLTMTGDLVGTLRYMSPEQALAKRVVVDHRTDIYSLGATLYELLTLEPAFTGTDRQELLRQIAFEEPRPPRRRHKSIPAELEIIVLKALEKNPAERYATAKDLAEDLRRFVMDRPIQARRPTPIQRIRKWARRHRSAATAAAACLLVTLGVTLGSVGWVLGDRNSRKRQAEAIVLEALEAAKPGLEQGNPWDHALVSALRQAEAQLQSGLLNPEVQARVEQLQKDVKMLAELERIFLEPAQGVRNDSFDFSGMPDEFGKAFRAYGIDVALLESDEAVTLVQRSAIRNHLVAALFMWTARLSKWWQEETPEAEKLFKLVVQTARPLERRLFETILFGDPDEIERVLLNAHAAEQAPLIIVELAGHFIPGAGLRSQKSASSSGVEFLRRVQAHYPANFWINHYLAMELEHLQPPRLEDAVGFYRAAVALRPESPGTHLNLAFALSELGRQDEAVIALRKAIELKPNYASAHCQLGKVLSDKGLLDEAITELRTAIELNPDDSAAHTNLGANLLVKGMLDEAITECRKAIELEPDNAEALTNLGAMLHQEGKKDEAIDVYRRAIVLKPDLAMAHSNLGSSLQEKGKLDEAITEFRKAIELEPNLELAHNGLGSTLAHKGLLDEATPEIRKAIELKPDYAEAHVNLGAYLVAQGHFADGLSARKRGHELGSKQPGWKYPSARWVREAEFMVELDAKLPKILKGEAQPTDVAERIGVAQVCQTEVKKLYLTAFRFYVDAFAAQPQLADDFERQLRYGAACAAALAGCGEGNDADQTDDKERARLRRQALDWLRADLAAYRQLLDKEPDKARRLVVERMVWWQQDKDFAGVRAPEALAKLPEAERAEWTKLWQDVAALGKQAAEGKGTQPVPVTEPELVPVSKEASSK